MLKHLIKLKDLILRIYNFVKPFKDDRLNLFFLISFTLAVVYIVRLYLLVFVSGGYWIRLVEKQYEGAIRLSYERGRILDRNGTPLAISEKVFSIYLRPSEAKREDILKAILLRDEKILKKYAEIKRKSLKDLKEDLKILDYVSREDIEKAFKKRFTVIKVEGKEKKIPFVWLKKKIDCGYGEIGRGVKTILKIYYTLSGEKPFSKRHPDIVGYVPEYKRVYPYRVGSVILGITGSGGEGLAGLEKYLEKEKIITGETVTLVGEKDTRGRVYLGGQARLFLSRKRGNNVVLTIDGNLQYIFEKIVEEFAQKWHPNFINAVLMDPRTGDILSAVSYPFYRYGSEKKNLVSKLTPRFITAPFEPGSVMKPITLAGALNEGIISKDTVFECPADYTVGKKTFHNEFHGRDVKLKAWEIIKYSDNVGIIKVAWLLGKEKLYRYLKAFGFGEKTGIELPGENPGKLRHWSKWRDVEFATLAFGHNIMATTLQLAVAYSALVNGGIYVKPRLLLAVVDDKGKVIKEFPVVKKGRVISPEVSAVMRRILTTVVEGGTGKATRFENYFVGGKTGTAVKWDPSIRDYNRSKITASFVGAFPMTDPRYVLAVTVDEPKVPRNMLWASKIAVPLFRALAERTLLYERIPPDRRRYEMEDNGTIVWTSINEDFVLSGGLQDRSSR